MNTEFKKDDTIKVMMHPTGYVIGQIQHIETLMDGRSFYYVRPDRVYKDGKILPASVLLTENKLLCIPAYDNRLVRGSKHE